MVTSNTGQDHPIVAFASDRPLLLVDADEVLLQFINRLEQYLTSQGYELRLTSFRLGGNIYNSNTGEKAEPDAVKGFIAGFFDTCVDDIAPVAGAAKALEALSKYYQIAILSNVPAHCRNRRATNLKQHGMDYPVIANKGDKGPAVNRLSQFGLCRTVFIDDLPTQHTSVMQHAPQAHRIHFVADQRLQTLIPPAPDAHVRIDCWAQLTHHLLGLLEGSHHAARN